MKRTSLLITLVLIGFASCKRKTFSERILAEVEQFNQKEAPKRLDPYTTFDSMRYDADRLTIQYFYTVEGDADSELFPAEPVKQKLLENVQTSIQLKAHKEHGLSFRYLYLSKSTRKPIIDCIFTPEDYTDNGKR